MRCHKCGNEAPQGSAFCNRCGTPLNSEMACPMCGNMIPANSVFCPKCGKMVRNDMDDSTTAQAQQSSETFNQQHQREQEQRQRQEQQRRQREQAAANAWENNDDDGDDDDTGGSSFNRNLLIGIAAAVVLIGGLLLLRTCGNSDNDRRTSERADSTLTQQVSSQDPLAIFAAELNRNNLMGDGAAAIAAVLVPGSDEEHPDRIWGITSLSDGTSRSFFKIYQLTRSGSLWQPENMLVKYLDERSITFDNSAMLADVNTTPRAVKIGDKECLYFVYMDLLGGEGQRGRLALNAFDMKAKKLHQLNYEGTIKSRDDGRKYIYGKPLDSGSSPEMKFLKDEVKNIKILYFPTDEELKAEQEEREKEEMEKKMSSPDIADARWNQENKEKIDQANSGEEVATKKSTYDKPIFHKEDIANQVSSENYSVFLTKSGSVYGFDKNTRKYFTIYSKGAKEIGFNNSKNNLLGIRTTDGKHFQYNLASGTIKALKD